MIVAIFVNMKLKVTKVNFVGAKKKLLLEIICSNMFKNMPVLLSTGIVP